jgi:hypothetical protein
MAELEEHITMKLYDAAGRDLISREIALEIARLVFIDVFGQDDFEKQAPLMIRDEGSTWLVEGSREYDYDSQPADQILEGNAIIEIAKRNGAIVRLSKKVDFARAPDDGSTNTAD